MFLSHLNFFISLIALLIYLSRIKGQRVFEMLLTIFTLIYSSTSGIWLAYFYYGFKHPLFVDNYGVLVENYALIIPLYIVFFIRYKIPTKWNYALLVTIILLGLLLYGVHHIISDNSSYFLLHPLNSNYQINLNFQIGVDIAFLALFAFLFLKNKSFNREVFDGNFKRIFGIVFSTYYIQDIIILFLLKEESGKSEPLEYLYYSTLALNFIITILLTALGVLTNWLSVWHRIRQEEIDKGTTMIPMEKKTFLHIPLNQLGKTGQIDWNYLKSTFYSSHSEIIMSLDKLEILTKTEKMYVFLSQFDYNQKELAHELVVSLRTVETNFYRVRQKLKKNNLVINYFD